MASTRRDLLRSVAHGVAAWFCGLCGLMTRAIAKRARPVPPVGGHRNAEIAIAAPRLADGRYPIPVRIHIGPLPQGERVESVELSLAGAPFPGLARFTYPPSEAIDCQVRLERDGTLLATARLSDGRCFGAAHRLSVFTAAARVS